MSERSTWLRTLLLALSLAVMCLYPLYFNYQRGLGLAQFDRHIGFLTGDILFPNPWQYRILSHYLVELLHWVYTYTVGAVVDIEAMVVSRLPADASGKFEQTQALLELLRKPGFVTYNIVFVALRAVQHLAIFLLAYRLYRHFTRDRVLLCLGVIVVSWSFGNAVNDSDLAFNTYFDVIFYLLAAHVVLSGRHDWAIVPLAILGAFNRETSVLIPFVYFVGRIDWRGVRSVAALRAALFAERRVWIVTAVAYACFWAIFVGLRVYYGMEAYQGVKGTASTLDILRINLFSASAVKTYFELYGTFAVLPLLLAYYFRRLPYPLQVMMLTLVPLWLGVHVAAAVAYQSRLFLVPTVLVFVPGTLALVAHRRQPKNIPVTEVTEPY